jgi:ring-1,2-phenylacetyl-CoA epoxidase subunit PaaE
MTVDTNAEPTESRGGPSGEATAARRHAVFHPLAVARIEPLTDDSVALTFDVPPELRAEYRFLAGQHVSLRFPVAGDDVRRNYSICSPATSGELRVAVKRLSGGVFSSYVLERLQLGDVMEVMTPSGRFTVAMDPSHRKHYCAIAAGSGITPILSLLATALAVEPHSHCTLIYGNRSPRTVMFLEDLADLKDRSRERLALIHVLSREPQDAELLNGRIDGPKLTALLDALVPPETVDEWLLCGPSELVDAARATLADRGVPAARIHRELFHVGPVPPHRVAPRAAAADAANVTVILDGRASSFPLRPDTEAILDATLKVRGDAPYACKNGMCGTCRAKLVTGTVEMDHNYALEADELAAGFVLACQSYPTSEAVTLDFDA